MNTMIRDAVEEAFEQELVLTDDLGTMEERLAARLRTLGREVLQRIVDRQDHGYQGSARPCPCGQSQRFLGYRPLQVQTLWGLIVIRRAYYWCSACGASQVPYDAQAGLGPEHLSPGLARACCLLATEDSFAQSSRKLQELLGPSVSPKTLERVVHHVGRHVLEQQEQELSTFRQDRQPPEAQVRPPQRLYVTADGTTVHQQDGWHEIKLGRLYWEDERLERQQRTVGRQDPAETFGWRLWLEACRCGLRETPEVVFLGDGAGWIRSLWREHFPRATFIVDWFHASEHLWQCGQELWGEGTAQARRWSQQREKWLWAGQTERLLADLAEQVPRCRGRKRKALQSLHRYVRTNQPQMQYDRFRSQGYDIGSGAVEGACKHVVGGRLKRSGMIWSRQGCAATLALRVTWLNGQWSALWASKPLVA